MHTHMNKPNTVLWIYWVLSHWVHFTVLRFISVYFVFITTYYVVLLQRGDLDLVGLKPDP